MEAISTVINQNICIICNKKLSSKQNLKQHMNIHSGNKPYVCTYAGCSSSYKHASQLSCHKLIHSCNDKATWPLNDDFKYFVELAIQTLTLTKKPSLKIPSGPYKREDASLPPLTLIKFQTKLPSVFDLKLN